ncbi:DUF899 domain-containing protein [Labrenzia sp. CE80]|uniref:DUF899 domain-containing protein n=1 Tax=Labrenzia sp. CE80 TaxID=1788986 RepID=UPI00129B8C6A|nr:DUF899 domain-containing protein [Labrenzia sp. CE80]
MASHPFASREDWLTARLSLLKEEKALTRERDRLAAVRRNLPLVLVDTRYVFDTLEGAKDLPELFAGRSQLVVYHFMFGKTWEEGCPSCSFWADNYERLNVHLAARDTTLVTVSSAPLEKLTTYRERMGWTFEWVSTAGSSFGIDFGVTFPGKESPTELGYNFTGRVFGEEMPGVSTFLKLDDGRIAHSYSTYGRGLDILNMAYNLLDLTPMGRQEENLPHPMAWVRRRDQYEAQE